MATLTNGINLDKLTNITKIKHEKVESGMDTDFHDLKHENGNTNDKIIPLEEPIERPQVQMFDTLLQYYSIKISSPQKRRDYHSLIPEKIEDIVSMVNTTLVKTKNKFLITCEDPFTKFPRKIARAYNFLAAHTLRSLSALGPLEEERKVLLGYAVMLLINHIDKGLPGKFKFKADPSDHFSRSGHMFRTLINETIPIIEFETELDRVLKCDKKRFDINYDFKLISKDHGNYDIARIIYEKISWLVSVFCCDSLASFRHFAHHNFHENYKHALNFLLNFSFDFLVDTHPLSENLTLLIAYHLNILTKKIDLKFGHYGYPVHSKLNSIEPVSREYTQNRKATKKATLIRDMLQRLYALTGSTNYADGDYRLSKHLSLREMNAYDHVKEWLEVHYKIDNCSITKVNLSADECRTINDHLMVLQEACKLLQIKSEVIDHFHPPRTHTDNHANLAPSISQSTPINFSDIENVITEINAENSHNHVEYKLHLCQKSMQSSEEEIVNFYKTSHMNKQEVLAWNFLSENIPSLSSPTYQPTISSRAISIINVKKVDKMLKAMNLIKNNASIINGKRNLNALCNGPFNLKQKRLSRYEWDHGESYREVKFVIRELNLHMEKVDLEAKHLVFRSHPEGVDSWNYLKALSDIEHRHHPDKQLIMYFKYHVDNVSKMIYRMKQLCFDPKD